jgi:glycine hydroxymethyltransferase
VQGGPLMHIVAAKAVCFKEAMEPSFADTNADRRERATRWPPRLPGMGSAS